MSDRRYDTQTLIKEMKRERRSSVYLALAGVAIAGALAGYFVYVRPPAVPSVPVGPLTYAHKVPPPGQAVSWAPAAGSTASTAAPAGPAGPPALSSPASATPASTAAAKPEAAAAVVPQPALATLTVELSRPGALWLDGESVGKEPVRQHKAQLPAGKHALKAKIGKTAIQQTLEVQSGKHYRVSIDAKRRKAVVEIL